jgi:hypothetical protein
MAEVLAEQKFACPACGGEAIWNAARQALVCAFCSTVSPARVGGGGQIEEHDLVQALRRIPDDARGWQAERRSVKCQSCRAISVVEPSQAAQRCSFCGSAQLVPYQETKAALRPESVLPFQVPEPRAREIIRDWYGKVWFAPNALKRRALTDTVKGLYLPYWTFDAQVHASWTAEAGYYYYVTEHYRDSQGETRTRSVQHTRWEWKSGSLDHFFDDDLVCASVGVQSSLVQSIEPFPTTQKLVPYNAGYVAGWTVERYQIDLVSAAQRSRAQMDAKVRSLCADEVPGDTQRNLEVDADYSRQTFKHILVPVWLLTYGYGAKHFQVAINGYTGAIAGQYPKSAVKIALAVLAVIALALLALYLFKEGGS